MKMIDTNGDLGDYLLDPNRKISKSHLDKVCKIYKKEKTCRYIGLSVNGHVCMKNSPMDSTLLQLSMEGKISARSDNCEGMCPE